MKITYLNPENVPLEKIPAGWMLKTELHPVQSNRYMAWEPVSWDQCCSKFSPYQFHDGQYPSRTYITQLPLPPEYLFDWDGSGLSFGDRNYQSEVIRARNDGKTIQYLREDGVWVNEKHWKWDIANYRIHLKHAAEYGLSPDKIEQMLQREGKPQPQYNCPPIGIQRSQEMHRAIKDAGILSSGVSFDDKQSAPAIPAGLPPIPLSQESGHHWEYRTPEQASGKECNGKNWMHLFGGDWVNLWKQTLRGGREHYLELVRDAYPCTGADPEDVGDALALHDACGVRIDTDSVEYWSTPERQRELRIQWANDPEMKRELWNEYDQKWIPPLNNSWNHAWVYRPSPKPLSQEERDSKAWDEQRSKLPGITPEEAWLAGIAYARSQPKA